jgi:hypothetical protein
MSAEHPIDPEELAQECYMAVMRLIDAATKLPDGDYDAADPVVVEHQVATWDVSTAIIRLAKELDFFMDLSDTIQEERAELDKRSTLALKAAYERLGREEG